MSVRYCQSPGKDDTERRIIVDNHYFPHWDSNQVWLITQQVVRYLPLGLWCMQCLSLASMSRHDVSAVCPHMRPVGLLPF